MGIFIKIEFDTSKFDNEASISVVRSCPVEIFQIVGGILSTREEQEDECTLCELCLEVAPTGALIIQKQYKNENLISRGQTSKNQISAVDMVNVE